MTARQLRLLVECRLAEAEEILREAEILLNQSAFRGSINRSYYAMFYAVLGLLATRGLGTSKHSGAIGSRGNFCRLACWELGRMPRAKEQIQVVENYCLDIECNPEDAKVALSYIRKRA